MLTLGMLQSLWPHGDQHVPGLVEGIAAAAPTVFPNYGLSSDLTIAHAMAQFSEECLAGLELLENLNYSAQGLIATWPTRFTASSAAQYAHSPRMIADVVYGGRMGNAPPPSDDGWTFRGRGLAQVTGRNNYSALSSNVGLDLISNPDLVADPANALQCGVAQFVLCGCLPYAEKDDVKGVTEHLNGGLIGFADRQAWLIKWKSALGVA
jgi:putative chitinase